MSGRTINISAPARKMAGCAIEFFLSGQLILNTGCAPPNIQTPIVINFETTKLPVING